MSHEAQTRLPWTAEEDAILISLVERYGEKRWNMVANGLPGRTGKGCSHRWRTYLRPDVKHPHLEPFTEWEAAVIVQAQREMGNNWLAIAKLLLPGRSNTAVKNFWHCRLKSGSGTNINRFIVNQYPLQYLLNEVPHEERIHPVALPAFPSTAPTGQLHPHSKHHEPTMMQLPIPMMDANPTMANAAAAAATQAYHIDACAAAAAAAADLMGAAGSSSSSVLGMTAGAAAAAAAEQASQDPHLDPKEDLRRRASAYVQQQLALMGQPVSRHCSGGGSSQTGALRPDSVTHTASHSQGNTTGCMLAPYSSMGWSGASGSYAIQMGVSGSPSVKQAGGTGRGRGRRPKPRDSCDDPYDETYVPAGMSREEEIARCSRNTDNSSPMMVSGTSGATVMATTCIGSQSTLIPTSTITEYPSMTMMDAAAAAAMPCMGDASSYDAAAAAAGATGPVHYGATATGQQQYGMPVHMAAGSNSIGTAAAAAAELDKMPWAATAAGFRISAGGYGLGSYNAAAPDGAAAAAASMYGSSACAGAAAAAHDSKLFKLEDIAGVGLSGFRQSDMDLKMSLSSIDDLLSGGNAAGSGDDITGLQSVAGLFRGTSLDGSRFSLTGSADGLGTAGRRSSRGCGFGSAQRVSHQQFVHIHHQQQQQQLEHMLMPPPKCHYAHGAAAAAEAVAGSSSSMAHQHQGGGSSSSAATSGLNAAAAAAAGHDHHSVGRCDSPFKAAAVQQAPFSPAMAAYNAAATAAAPKPAPSSQPTVCSAHAVTQLSNPSAVSLDQACPQQQQQQQQGLPAHAASQFQQQQQQQKLPATFESVLQAIRPLTSNASSAPAEGAGQQKQQQQEPVQDPSTATAAAVNPKCEQDIVGKSALRPDNHTDTNQKGPDCTAPLLTGSTPAAAAAVVNPLHLQCSSDAEQQQQHQRPSLHLVSPVGRYLGRPSDDGGLLLDEAMRVCSYDLHTAPDDSAQTRAERRSLRMLLGALASTDPLAWDAASADPAAAAAESGRRRGSSSRLSHSSLLSGGCGLGFSRRLSSRGAGGWYDLGESIVTAAAGGMLTGQPCIDRDMSLSRRTSIGVLVPRELGKRPRTSMTLTSPVGGALKRHRVSIMGGPGAAPYARRSVGADMDDCLSYWQN